MGKHKKSKKSKHHKKEKKRKRKSESDNEWIEKPSSMNEKSQSPLLPIGEQHKPQREEWIDLSKIMLTSSTSDRQNERELEKKKNKQENLYNPSKSSRELNPYWKDGGMGLPSFKKPSECSDDEERKSIGTKNYNWKTTKTIENSHSKLPSLKTLNDEKTQKLDGKHEKFQDKNNQNISLALDPNIIAAKLVKAEIMANIKLVEELKHKLGDAKQAKLKEADNELNVLLTETDSRGYTRPLKLTEDLYGPKKKKQKIETHSGNERMSYYADDDKYSLKQMFEAEKYNTTYNVHKEFAKIVGEVKKNDNLADLFIDKIRHSGSTSKDLDRAINQHKKMNDYLDNCSKCLQSGTMLKHLMIDYNDNCYLSLPSFEPLTEAHCLLIPVRHVSCSVQLDENEWKELNDLRLKLVQLLERKNKSVIFFEIAKSFNKYPHMLLECVPIPKRMEDSAAIYFKKAIEESETEWTHNKKLISLKNRDVRRAVPKGLSYFFVSFGMKEGFAHVIEDQSLFPNNFAQEIIGGMLDIHHSKWRKPKREGFDEQKLRVQEFNKLWRVDNKDMS